MRTKKQTKPIRTVDGLGRIVIPVEITRTHGIKQGDELEIYVEGDKIILQKHRPACCICGSVADVTRVKSKYICSWCRIGLVGISSAAN